MTTAEKWTIAITALGVIATFSAVFVALYQTKIVNRKRLKIEFNYVNYLIGLGQGVFSGIEISNIGNRKVIISSCDIFITKQKKMSLFSGGSIVFLLNNNPDDGKIPATLSPEDSLKIYIPLVELYNGIVNFQENYKGVITIEISDSTGKKHKARYKLSLQAVSDFLRGNA